MTGIKVTLKYLDCRSIGCQYFQQNLHLVIKISDTKLKQPDTVTDNELTLRTLGIAMRES